MANVFNCPACGARLSVDENETAVECLYCRNSVVVPSELRQPESSDAFYPPSQAKEPRRTLTRSQSRLVLLIFAGFFLFTFLPFCITFAFPLLAFAFALLGGIVTFLWTMIENLLHIFPGG